MKRKCCEDVWNTNNNRIYEKSGLLAKQKNTIRTIHV
jgi:hypothetical protein